MTRPVSNQRPVPGHWQLSERPHVVLAGGGTGGHLFPGLAVAAALVERLPEARITLAGSGSEFERRQVALAGYDYVSLACRPTPRGPWAAVRFLRDHWTGARQAGQFLDAQQVSAVVGLGGYVSVPMGRAAARRRLPLVLLEQNAVPGRATQWLAPSATVVCAALGEARPLLRSRAVRVVGNPVRPEFEALWHQRTSTWSQPVSAERPRLVVLGGSQGAETLNKQVPRALYKLGSRLACWQIVHQAGHRDQQATRELYRKLGLSAVVVPFIEQMAQVLAGSQLAISRAGGTTLAELSASGVPSLLLPHPRATDDHQRKNAEVFVSAGAAQMLDVREVTGRVDNALADRLAPLLLDAVQRRRMSQAMLRQARPDAAGQVADLVAELVTRPTTRRAG